MARLFHLVVLASPAVHKRKANVDHVEPAVPVID
jgi:hypothetical protein